MSRNRNVLAEGATMFVYNERNQRVRIVGYITQRPEGGVDVQARASEVAKFTTGDILDAVARLEARAEVKAPMRPAPYRPDSDFYRRVLGGKPAPMRGLASHGPNRKDES